MSDAAHQWGRVDPDGNVYVIEAEGERLIGQWPGGDPDEALAMYVRRYEGLEVEVDLLEKRLDSAKVSPDDAIKAVAAIREQLTEAQAIGDLAALKTRVDALEPKIEEQREARRVEREERNARAAQDKERIAGEAEQIASSDDWRSGADRLRALLDEWKQIPRLPRSADDELWHRFSSARTTYTKRRKAHFAEQSVKRDESQRIKEKLIGEAETLSSSTEWGPTTLAYRDLMDRWKKAGAAPRNVEDKLWKQFRAAQDAFFSARDAANAAVDEEYQQNAVVKEQILIEAEALLPVKEDQLDKLRKAWSDIVDRWETAGKVPRDRMKDLEGRLRAVEREVRSAEDRQWKRTDPEKSARADDMISKLEAAITEAEEKLEKARKGGDERRITKLEENLESRRAFLDIAKKTASDFS